MMSSEVAGSVATPPLRGRAAAIGSLEAWLGRRAAGAVSVLLVEGEAGIGKTRVLQAAQRLAADRGRTVLVGGADELERARPFGALLEAVRPPEADADPGWVTLTSLLGGDDSRDAGSIEPTLDPGRQYRIVDAILDAIEARAASGAVALLLDDLQWADHGTLITVNSLTRRLGYLDVAVLATLRPTPRTPDLGRLLDALRGRGADHVVLGPLDEHAVAAVAQDLLEAPPGPRLRSALTGAAGNPLFVTELVQAFRADGALEVVAGQAELSDVALPDSLRSTILLRLASFGDDTVEALRRVSVLGSTFSLRDVASVLDTPVPEALRILREPMQAGVLAASEGRLGFRHDLIRSAVYDDMLEDLRAALHREAGRRLADAGAPTLEVAEHLVLGARPGDREAVAYLHQAAHTAARHAPAIAVELLERALELVGMSIEMRMPILADLVPVLLWAGRPGDAEERAREALASGTAAALGGSVRIGLVRALAVQGRYQELIVEADRSRGAAGLSDDVGSQLAAEAANAALLLGDDPDAEARARSAVASGTPTGSEGAESGLLILSDLARGRGEFERSLRYAEEALERSEARPGVRAGWRPEIFVAMALRSLDRFDEADAAIQRGRRTDEQLGRVSFLPVYSYELATGRYLAGRWTEAEDEAAAGLAVADEAELVMLRSWPHSVLALVAVHRGDLGGAAAQLAAAVDHGSRRGPHQSAASPRLALAQGLLELASGDPPGALATLERAWSHHERRGHGAARWILGPDLARLAVLLGDRERASRVARGLEEAVATAPGPSHEGAALLCRGLADADPDVLIRSAQAYRRGPRVLDHARACEDAGAALARVGRHREATAMFDAALTTFDEVGADHDAARALATARELGIGRKRRGPRGRPAYGWGALTRSELEVVRLAADGLTNPEIGQRLYVSRRTVQTHLSNAFRKLEISSRVELAAEAARRGGVEGRSRESG
jgi:DNA-binding CsgD family transcriptional regulator